MTEYVSTGSLQRGGVKVEQWAPRQSDAQRLRAYLLERHGTVYGASDDDFAAVAAEARAYVAASGRRWSWTTVAAKRVYRAANWEPGAAQVPAE